MLKLVEDVLRSAPNDVISEAVQMGYLREQVDDWNTCLVEMKSVNNSKAYWLRAGQTALAAALVSIAIVLLIIMVKVAGQI